jgi:CoA:oxalate CoA-transferase
MSGMPIKMSRIPCKVAAPPPTLGQHNTDVLKALLGMTDSKIESLKKMEVI